MSTEQHVLDLLRETGIEPRRVGGKGGGEYHSACPGCGGSKRFRVWAGDNDGNGAYNCRPDAGQCGKHGDNIQFCIDFLGMNFQDAAAKVGRKLDGGRPATYRCADRMKAPVRKTRPEEEWQPRTYDMPNETYIDKAGEFARWAHEKLLKNAEQLDWLAARGVSLDAVRAFCLGWNPGPKGDDAKDLYSARKSWGLPAVITAGNKPKPVWLPVGLVIPHIREGRVIRIQIRRHGKPRKAFQPELKYYFVPDGCSATMILGPECRAHVVVEAALDGIACYDATGGKVGAVVLWSVSNRPDAYATGILRRDCTILEALDFEDNEDNRKSRQWWQSNFEQTERWPVPAGKDPGEAYKAGVDIRAWLFDGLPPVLQLELAEKEAQPSPEHPGQSIEPGQNQKEGGGDVEGLAALLAGTPVCIVNTPEHYGLNAPSKEWLRRRPELFARISALLFRSDEVMSYLASHPATRINAANIKRKAA